MAATNTTANTVPSTVTAGASTASAAAEATSVPPTATSAGVKSVAAPTTTAADKQDHVEKLTRKLGCTLTTKGKCKGSIFNFDC